MKNIDSFKLNSSMILKRETSLKVVEESVKFDGLGPVEESEEDLVYSIIGIILKEYY
jgi:hypothetical protein